MKKPKIKFEIDRAVNNEFFVRIVARYGKQTFTSGETYKRVAGAKKAIDRLVTGLHALDYEIIELL
jgi:uncharacterized protein YegP (UPF0339 family)